MLRDRPDWPPERILGALKGENTIEVDLEVPIPVLIVYATAVVRDDGVHFLDDIYGRDAALERALKNRYPHKTD